MGKMSYVVAFAIGAVTGSVVTNLLLKKKYELIVQEEIDSIKQAYDKKATAEESIKLTDEEKIEVNTAEVKKSIDISVAQGYKTDAGEEEAKIRPVIITPDEFGEISTYEVKTLTYYADDILEDDMGNILKIDDTIGRKSLNHFGEYEDDVVHVRNAVLKTDYEVFRDPRRYDSYGLEEI